jgi:tetratricopeptide (TPR) repeat protein
MLTCGMLCTTANAQTVVENDESLRHEIKKQIDIAEQLLDVRSASSIDSAQSLLDSTVKVVRNNFDPDDTLLVMTYNILSRCRHASSDYETAATYALRALDILKEIQGEHHILALYSLEMLVEGCLQKHDLVSCEQYSDQRFDILENFAEPLTPLEAEQMMNALNDRARLLVLQNKYDEAISDLEYGLSFITDDMEQGPRLYCDMNGNIAWILARQRKVTGG